MVKSSVSSLRAGLTSGSCSGTGTGAGVNVDDGGVEDLISWPLVLAASVKFVAGTFSGFFAGARDSDPEINKLFLCSTHLSMEQEK